MSTNSWQSQVGNGFRLAGTILLFLLVAGLFFGGVDYVFFPAEHSRIVGLLFLAISVPIMAVTMSRWIKVLAGLLALAVLNGMLTIATGDLMANPARPVSRFDALYLTAFFAASAALAASHRRGKLAPLDRACVLAFLFSLALLLSYQGVRDASAIAPLTATDFTLMGIGLACLGVGPLSRRVRKQSL